MTQGPDISGFSLAVIALLVVIGGACVSIGFTGGVWYAFTHLQWVP